MGNIGKLLKGAILTSNGTQNIQIPVGSDGYVLTADSTSETGLSYKNVSGGGSGGNIKITKFETAGTYTWTKDPLCVYVKAIGIGGGSGGGGGETLDISEPSSGGGGGSGAGGFYYEFIASSLGSTETVIVGAGGVGGNGATGIDENGQDGSPGGLSAFSSISTLDESVFPTSLSGSFGIGGGKTVTVSPRSQPITTNFSCETQNSFGGLGANSIGSMVAVSGSSYPLQNYVASGSSYSGPGLLCNFGGGGGAGLNSGGVMVGAGAGGGEFSSIDNSVVRAGGSAGFNQGDFGGNGLDGGEFDGIFKCGTGGGGGAANSTGNGGNGGDGGSYGGGGGGGGSAVNGFTAGTGGAGGDGAVWVIEFLKGTGSGGDGQNVIVRPDDLIDFTSAQLIPVLTTGDNQFFYPISVNFSCLELDNPVSTSLNIRIGYTAPDYNDLGSVGAGLSNLYSVYSYNLGTSKVVPPNTTIYINLIMPGDADVFKGKISVMGFYV